MPLRGALFDPNVPEPGPGQCHLPSATSGPPGGALESAQLGWCLCPLQLLISETVSPQNLESRCRLHPRKRHRSTKGSSGRQSGSSRGPSPEQDEHSAQGQGGAPGGHVVAWCAVSSQEGSGAWSKAGEDMLYTCSTRRHEYLAVFFFLMWQNRHNVKFFILTIFRCPVQWC